MKTISGEVVNNRRLAQDLFKIDIFSPYVCKNVEPGQFINIKCSQPDQQDPLLRRPFSIYDIEKSFNVITILYQVKGKGTGYLSRLNKGDLIDFCGPLGQPIAFSSKKIMLIGGGIGIAPLLFIAKKCLEESRQVRLLAGFKDDSFRLVERDIMRLNIDYSIYCEQGNWANTGQVSAGLGDLNKYQDYDIYCCGPKPMLKVLQKQLAYHGSRVVALLEEWMACGVGVCAGCVIKIKSDRETFVYKKVCSDGPAFDLREVIFD